MAHYILQIIFFQLFFLLVYEIFLKKETFFNYNRLFLLVTPILAFLIPWLRLEFLVEAVPENARIIIPQAISGQPDIYRETLPTVFLHGESGLKINWWLIIYFTGLAASLFIFIRKYQHLNRLFSFRQVTKEKDFRIIEVPGSNAAYTFFNTVFLGDQLSESEKQHILSHELVHVKQKHSLDLLFFEILKIVCWFNPLIYIYQNRIAGLHEFIADDEVVKTTEKKTYYEQLLNTAFNTQNISFINQFFNHSLIKKRILMLQKNKSSKLSKFKFLLVIPLILAMLTYVACADSKQSESEMETIYETKDENSGDLRQTLEELEDLNSEQEKILKGYAEIDVPPAFQGCENLEGEARRKCTTRKISAFVGENFNSSIGKEVGLTGTNRVVVKFKIDEAGNIVDINSRAAHASLEKEAKRVISSLPQMEPGRHNGEPVSVMYSLPIAFKVSE